MAALGGLHHAALSVRDLEASVRWYHDLLDLEPAFRQDSDARRMVVMKFPGSRQTLGLVQHAEHGDGAGFDARNLGLDHLALSVASGEELASWAARFDEHGVGHSGPTETPFGGMLHFTDPDGIALALFWERSWGNDPQSRDPQSRDPQSRDPQR